MDPYAWLREFTAFVQLISAVNFTYMFTHFADKVYSNIFSNDEVINEKYSSFRDGKLEKVKSSIENMNPIVVNGHETNTKISCLKRNLEDMINKWNQEENATQQIINNLKEAKGVKSLFLYISIYCVLDMLNMALINTVDYRPIYIYVYATNIFAFSYAILITSKVICSSWKGKKDIYCYNKTRKYITRTVFFAVLLAITNEMLIYFHGASEIPDTIIILTLALCVFLPMYPCLFSILFILYKIVYITIRRWRTQIRILHGIFKLDKKKKKLENAISTIMDDVNWG